MTTYSDSHMCSYICTGKSYIHLWYFCFNKWTYVIHTHIHIYLRLIMNIKMKKIKLCHIISIFSWYVLKCTFLNIHILHAYQKLCHLSFRYLISSVGAPFVSFFNYSLQLGVFYCVHYPISNTDISHYPLLYIHQFSTCAHNKGWWLCSFL